MRDTVPLDATCAVCRWWHPLSGQASNPYGHCHRNAPAAGGWPLTNADEDVCGEWQTDYIAEERTGCLTPRRTPRHHPSWSEVRDQVLGDIPPQEAP